MAMNGADKVLMERRRLMVADYAARGVPQRRIVDYLYALYVQKPKENPFGANPDGEAWSIGTINHDIQVARTRWRKNAERHIGDHIARQLAELGEVKKAAWAQGDYEGVRRTIETEMKLLGTSQYQLTIRNEDWKTDLIAGVKNKEFTFSDLLTAFGDFETVAALFREAEMVTYIPATVDNGDDPGND
jgi:hypothetical protein